MSGEQLAMSVEKAASGERRVVSFEKTVNVFKAVGDWLSKNSFPRCDFGANGSWLLSNSALSTRAPACPDSLGTEVR